MPKVLFINATLNWGSTGRITEQIAETAEKHGWTCYIAHGSRYVMPSHFPSIPVGRKLEDYMHAFKSKLLCAHGQGSYFPTKRLIKKIIEIHPDVIHLHNIHGYYLNYVVLFEYLKEAKIPVVWTLHDCWSMTGHCTHFDGIGCERWKTGCFNCPILHRSYNSWFLDRSSKNYQLKKREFTSLDKMIITPVSKWLESVVKESYLKCYPTKVIYNGIDLNMFDIRKTNLREKYHIGDKFVVLGVAREWSSSKGIEEFIRLSRNSLYQIILIGVTDDLQKQLPENIICVHRTYSQQEMSDFYNMADVMANPTYNDSFPTINLEALACGTPVVTYKTGGSPEAIDDNTGIVVPRGDYDALINALEVVRKSGKGFYQEACRKRAVDMFNKDSRFEDYIKVYQSFL